MNRYSREWQVRAAHPACNTVLEAVAFCFSRQPDELRSEWRWSEYLAPRQVGMFLCRELTGASLQSIAAVFNREDHTTVVNAVARVKLKAAADPLFALDVERARQEATRRLREAKAS